MFQLVSFSVKTLVTRAFEANSYAMDFITVLMDETNKIVVKNFFPLACAICLRQSCRTANLQNIFVYALLEYRIMH